MKSPLLVVILFVFSINHQLFGQYNYDAYHFPELKVQGLVFNFNTNGNHSIFKFYDDNVSKDFGYHLGANYFRFLNGSHQQKTDVLSLNNSYTYARSIFQPVVDSKIENFNLNFIKEQINRKYLNNEPSFLGLKGKFFEFNHRLSFYHNKEIGIYYTAATADIALGFGFGRLEPVSEIFDAQFLMNDLLDSGMIQTKFSENELFELAALMANVKNQRVFDFRRANIYQLTELSKWLENKGIPQNIKTFTILNDNWTGNFIAQRLQGKRLTFLVSPWADQRWSSQNSSQLDRGGSASVTYIAAKNKSLYIGTEMKLKLSHSITPEFPNANNVTTLSGGYSWIFNPNSRTTISASATLALATQKFDNYAAQVSIPMSLNYFINNRARISGNLNVNWLTNDNSIFERQIELREFNPNFQSEASNQNLFNSSFSSSHFNISGRLNFSYTLF